MWKKSIVLGLILLTAACAPATATPTMIPEPPLATATPTQRPGLSLQQAAGLYAGPGNVDFDLSADLKPGDTVDPVGTYGDFVKVIVNSGGREMNGFIWKDALPALPGGLPELTGEQVPLAPIYEPQCSPGVYDPAQNSVTITNDGDNYYDTESDGIPIAGPISLRIQSMAVQGADAGAIKILGIPESADPWWKGIIRLDVGSSNGNYFIGIRDGTVGDYVFYQELPLRTSQALRLVFDQPAGKSFSVFDDQNKLLLSLDVTQTHELKLPDGLFPQGSVYLGRSVAPHSALTLTGMEAGTAPDGKWIETQAGVGSGPGLAELAAAHGLTIGTEFVASKTSDLRYCRAMRHDFNVAVLSEFSDSSMWLAPGQYDFTSLDHAVDYAVRQGWRVRASHLVWGAESAIPGWLAQSHLTRDEYIQILKQHIGIIVGRYKGRVQDWSIANEAPARSFYAGGDFWNEKIGPEYIGMAFRWAREADPAGILMFNQDNNESPRDAGSKRIVDKMYSTLQQLKADGVPVDVVGMQMHLFLPWNSKLPPTREAVIATMRKFSALGVRIYVTEFDVDLTRQSGTPADKLDYEAQLYRDMLQACLESGVCDSFATWGISDSTSWLTSMCPQDWCMKEQHADPLMFDRAFNPKPAYFAVRDVLMNDFEIAPTATP